MATVIDSNDPRTQPFKTGPVGPSDCGPVPAALNALLAKVAELGDTVGSLREDLEFVLAPEPPSAVTAGQADRDSMIDAPILTILDGLHAAVGLCNANIEVIRKRLVL